METKDMHETVELEEVGHSYEEEDEETKHAKAKVDAEDSDQLLAACGICMCLVLIGGMTVAYFMSPHPIPPPIILTPFFAEHGLVASDSPNCSDIGSSILQDGGNAVDAAIASALCLGVMRPFASGLGGGGVMMIRLANGSTYLLDGREVAPADSSSEMYYADPSSSQIGPMSIGVPGEIKLFEEAFRRFGSGNYSWSDLFQPAIDLALNGFKVESLLAQKIATQVESLGAVSWAQPLLDLIAPGGTPLKEGDVFYNPRLAETLQTLSEEGADAFYTGRVAADLIQDLSQVGSIINAQDLADYRVRQLPVLETYFHGLKVHGASPPFTGGPIIAETLNILEQYNLPLLWERGHLGPAYHVIVEALKFGYANRMLMSDPDFADMTNILAQMTSKDHAGELRNRIWANSSFEPDYYADLGSLNQPLEDSGTAHLSVVDAWRNAVALTTTVNLAFGSKVLSPSTGLILNDQMDDFATSNSSNAFGYPPSYANRVEPGKRPLSSMSPTIVTKNGNLHLVLGGSGGSRIITGTLQVLLNIFAGNQNIKEAVFAPRFHAQLIPNEVVVEEGFSSRVSKYLSSVGHQVTKDEFTNAIQVVLVDKNNTLWGASDPRKDGEPAGYR